MLDNLLPQPQVYEAVFTPGNSIAWRKAAWLLFLRILNSQTAHYFL